MDGLRVKLVKGSVLRAIDPVIQIIIAFFMIPFVIKSIGDRWYGLWILVSTLVGYYGFLDLGISTANTRFISRAMGKDDSTEINSVFNNSLFCFFIIGLISLFISIIIVLFCPVFVSDPSEISIFRTVIFLIGIDISISFPLRAFIGFLYANIRYDIVTSSAIAKVLLRTLLLVLFLNRGHGIIALAAITICVDMLQYAWIIIYVLKSYSFLKIEILKYSKRIIRELIGYGSYTFISSLSKQLRFKLDSYVITAFLNLRSVTHYNIASRIAQYYLLLLKDAISMMTPVFSKMEGMNDFGGIRDKYILISKLNAIISVYIGGSIIIFGKAFIMRWMGQDYLDSYQVMIVLCFGMIFYTMQISSRSLLFGISKHKFYAMVMLGEGIVNLILSIILIRKYGILGVAIGTTIPMFITSVFLIPVYANRVINLKLLRYLKVVGTALVLGSAVHLGNWLIIRNMIEVSYLRIFLLGILTSMVFFTITVFSLLKRKERAYFNIPF